MSSLLVYPSNAAQRTDWIVAQRPPRNPVDPSRPYAFFVEDEHAANAERVPVATLFLTNRECPWRCAMCDLWKNTLTDAVEPGAIPHQIRYALHRLPVARQIKLYNSGSFFDTQAIPPQDDAEIAALVRNFDRVIVESHPALVNDRCFAFRKMLAGRLEVAIGLETAHPQVLDKLNKRMTVEQFVSSAEALRAHDIDLRVFLLVQPPFIKSGESARWMRRSIDVAFDAGATAVSLIPSRSGNGAMENLAQQGAFVPPTVAALESSVEYGLGLHRGRIFADLWDLRQTQPKCTCWPARIDRLHTMNLTQAALPHIECARCGVRS